jgi:hypothetical protein
LDFCWNEGLPVSVLSTEGDANSIFGTPDLAGAAFDPPLSEHQIEGESDVERARHFEARSVGGEIADDAIDRQPVPMEDDLRRLQAAKTGDFSPFDHQISSDEMLGGLARRREPNPFHESSRSRMKIVFYD